MAGTMIRDTNLIEQNSVQMKLLKLKKHTLQLHKYTKLGIPIITDREIRKNINLAPNLKTNS